VDGNEAGDRTHIPKSSETFAENGFGQECASSNPLALGRLDPVSVRLIPWGERLSGRYRGGKGGYVAGRCALVTIQLAAAKVSRANFRGKTRKFSGHFKGPSQTGMSEFESSEVSQRLTQTDVVCVQRATRRSLSCKSGSLATAWSPTPILFYEAVLPLFAPRLRCLSVL
jgi:hypothetical protein